MTFKELEKYLLDAEGKEQDQLGSENPYRQIGFDQAKMRLGWLRAHSVAKVEEVLNEINRFIAGKENFIFIGMGGSANGIKTLFSLFDKSTLFVLDSLDPAALHNILVQIKDLNKTLVIPISKSGTTKETLLIASTLKELFLNQMAPNQWQNHFLWLADPAAFDKLNLTGWEGVKKFSIQVDCADDIGGRFSCPSTLIFLLPLFLFVGRDFAKLQEVYQAYSAFQAKIREEAYALAEDCKDRRQAYFHPVVAASMRDIFASWLYQLFQESLGGKVRGFSPKTVVYPPQDKSNLIPIELKAKTDGPLVRLMAEMYFFQVFVAFFAAFKGANFVNQDCVERYKAQMRSLEGTKAEEIASQPLEDIIRELKEKLKPNVSFVDIVLYFYPQGTLVDELKQAFSEAFPTKIITVVIGSDWNHHSYQAAVDDENTFFLLLLSAGYNTSRPFVSQETLSKNVDTLKLISKATHLTLPGKSLLLSLTL